MPESKLLAPPPPPPVEVIDVPAVPWQDVHEAFSYVRSRRALLVEGESWRVELGPLTDITITIRGSVGRQALPRPADSGGH